MGRFFPGSGNMAERNERLSQWVKGRVDHGLWPYALVATADLDAESEVVHPTGPTVKGINLTSVDYLGLAYDERLKEAAIRAIRDHGHHTPSSRPLAGHSPHAKALEASLTEFMGRRSVYLCSTGWAAAYTAVAGVVRRDDFVVMDELAHSSLQNGAYASTPNVQTFRHLDNEHLRSRLAAIREDNPKSGILVMTEGLFSMDGDAPDMKGLVEVSKEYDAMVLVDVAHDLGSTGPGGTGTIGVAGLLDDVDIIAGAFSKSFGTNGGFVSTKSSGVEWAQLCFGSPFTFSTGISPVQIGVAAESLAIVTSPEGDTRREAMMDNVLHIRAGAEARGLGLFGHPSPIVPVNVGKESHARLAGMFSFQAGFIATCLEFPVVQRGVARYRLSLSPNYTKEMLDSALDIIVDSIERAKEFSAELERATAEQKSSV